MRHGYVEYAGPHGSGSSSALHMQGPLAARARPQLSGRVSSLGMRPVPALLPLLVPAGFRFSWHCVRQNPARSWMEAMADAACSWKDAWRMHRASRQIYGFLPSKIRHCPSRRRDHAGVSWVSTCIAARRRVPTAQPGALCGEVVRTNLPG